MPSKPVAAILLLAALPAAPSSAKDPLESVRARMDKAASEFKSMTANVTYVTHTDVLNENTTETGTVSMEVQAGEVHGLLNVLTPDKYVVAFEKRLLQRYLPKINTIQIWNLDKHGEQLDEFLRIGFGTSGTMLAKDYDMTVAGTGTLKGFEATPTIRLRLIPKAGEVKEYVKQLELWIPETGDPYPLQEKISAPSGDYRLITYTGMKINSPLAPDALKLKAPASVKTEYPGK